MAGMTVRQMSTWLQEQATHDMPGLPMIGLFRELFQDRHLNRSTTWKANDLTDMLYLSCATAYADFTICERYMGSMLEQGLKRLGRPPKVFRRLGEAVVTIANTLADGQAGQEPG